MRWPDQTSALCSVDCGRCRVYSAVKLLRRVQGGCVTEEDTEGCKKG